MPTFFDSLSLQRLENRELVFRFAKPAAMIVEANLATERCSRFANRFEPLNFPRDAGLLVRLVLRLDRFAPATRRCLVAIDDALREAELFASLGAEEFKSQPRAH